MGKVKGSKQPQMVVVPHRPAYRLGMMIVAVLLVLAGGALTYYYGLDQGLATKVAVIAERDTLKQALGERDNELKDLRRQLARFELGDVVDTRANEEVRLVVEELQSQIAQLNEEIRFYKGVMVPKVDEKGLRIERLTVTPTGVVNQYRYNVLLTQVVDEHDYVAGQIEIKLTGARDGVDVNYGLKELSDDGKAARGFRYRYFQELEGHLNLPPDFVPRQISVVLRPSGSGDRSQRTFNWQQRSVASSP